MVSDEAKPIVLVTPFPDVTTGPAPAYQPGHVPMAEPGVKELKSSHTMLVAEAVPLTATFCVVAPVLVCVMLPLEVPAAERLKCT